MIIVVFVVLSICFNSLNKSKQKLQHKNRCETCNSRLKAVNGKYATTCRKCSHVQSWAVPSKAPAVTNSLKLFR